MNDQQLSYAVAPGSMISAPAWLPASYRAHAVQQGEHYVTSRARTQARFISASRKISRINKAQPNIITAGMLAFFFGPIGMLYATPIGAIVMAAADLGALLFMHTPQLVMAWLVGVMWSIVTVVLNNARRELYESS